MATRRLSPPDDGLDGHQPETSPGVAGSHASKYTKEDSIMKDTSFRTFTITRAEIHTNNIEYTMLENNIGSAALLTGMAQELARLCGLETRVVQLLGDFALLDGDGNVLFPIRDWGLMRGVGVENCEFWEPRTLLRYLSAMLFSHAVTSDSFRYIQTIGQALAALPEILRKNTFLLVAGGGDIEQYMLIAGRAGVADKVVFAGASSEIPALISASDLMIHPARKEATGTVIVESLAIGVPVIASAACGYADFTGNIDDKLVTPEPFCQENLNRALVYALENLKLLKIKTLAIAENDPDFYRRSDVILNLLENS